jgi:hypothetical protein
MAASSEDIPALRDINCYGSLDEQVAVEHFLGKNLQEAEALFVENAGYYMEDLMWMGPHAFCYYVNAAVLYLKSASAFGDSYAIRAFISAIQFQLAHASHETRASASLLAEVCGFVVAHWDRFHMNTSDIELRNRYIELHREYAQVAEQRPTTGA